MLKIAIISLSVNSKISYEDLEYIIKSSNDIKNKDIFLF